MREYQYRVIKSPIGNIHLVGDGKAVEYIFFRKSEMGRSVNGKFVHNPTAYPRAVRELEKYFSGKATQFSFPFNLMVDGFTGKVLKQLAKVPFGKTVSYKELAKRAGSPKAYRAAGSACARNPLPIVIPCHRVLNSDGSTGGWSGLPGVKERLLDLENANYKRK